jgi:hypothetical protein
VAETPNDRVFIDLSCIKKKENMPEPTLPHWLIVVDDCTQLKRVDFFKSKNNMVENLTLACCFLLDLLIRSDFFRARQVQLLIFHQRFLELMRLGKCLNLCPQFSFDPSKIGIFAFLPLSSYDIIRLKPPTVRQKQRRQTIDN